MTLTTPTHGLPGCFLLRLAHRLASPAAYERVFVPLLADFQFEYGRVTSPAPAFVSGCSGSSPSGRRWASRR